MKMKKYVFCSTAVRNACEKLNVSYHAFYSDGPRSTYLNWPRWLGTTHNGGTGRRVRVKLVINRDMSNMEARVAVGAIAEYINNERSNTRCVHASLTPSGHPQFFLVDMAAEQDTVYPY